MIQVKVEGEISAVPQALKETHAGLIQIKAGEVAMENFVQTASRDDQIDALLAHHRKQTPDLDLVAAAEGMELQIGKKTGRGKVTGWR